MNKIFFDLDGTLIHAHTRLYRLFQHLVPESKLSYEQYWERKRSPANHELIHGTVATGADDWYVGDTGIDIRTGKQLGVRTVAVLSGFRSEEALVAYEPDYVINDVRELLELLSDSVG